VQLLERRPGAFAVMMFLTLILALLVVLLLLRLLLLMLLRLLLLLLMLLMRLLLLMLLRLLLMLVGWMVGAIETAAAVQLGAVCRRAPRLGGGTRTGNGAARTSGTQPRAPPPCDGHRATPLPRRA
jgi:hypothetical protein